jgi:transcription elongation GreA/GreB family factor
MNTTTTKPQSGKKTILLSKKGIKELRKSIAQLEHDRMGIRKSLRESDKSTSHDDRFARSENLLRLEVLESELAEKQYVLSHAKIISSRSTRMKVAIGSVVDLIDQQGRLIRYTLVESIEANPSDGRISAASPLGSTLLGKTVQDIVEWGNGLHQTKLQLVKIT